MKARGCCSSSGGGDGSTTTTRRAVVVKVFVAACVVSLVMDPHFNFSALKPILLSEGVFANSCPGTSESVSSPSSQSRMSESGVSASASTLGSQGRVFQAEATAIGGNRKVEGSSDGIMGEQSGRGSRSDSEGFELESGAVCERQLALLNSLFIAFSGTLNSIGFLYGLIVDKLSRRKCIIISFVLLSFWPVFGFLTSDKIPLYIQIWALPLTFILSGVGGGFSFVVGLKLMNDVDLAFPEGHIIFNSGFVSSFIQACVNLCGAVAWILYLIYNATHAPLWALFGGYYLACLGPLFCFFVVSSKPKYKTDAPQVELETAPNELQDKSLISNPQSSRKDVILQWFKSHLGLLIPLYAAMMSGTSFVYFYMATMMEQLNMMAQGDQITPLLTAFSVMLPLWGFLSNFPLSYPLSKKHWLWIAWTVEGVLFVLFAGFSLIPVLNLQYLTFILLIPLRLALFSLLYCTVNAFFPAEIFGRVAYGALTFAGVSIIISGLLLNKVALKFGCYLYINGAFGALSVVICGWVGIVLHRPPYLTATH
ncbi:hypothetical protein Pelo_11884 [Pelomyxa schiedti]|nr:hypothetical protein Pelo_11884 [Pelomyxa schiedti]